MLPSEIASIASAFSGVTATVSLIYVGIQIRLSMRHLRALIQQGTTARSKRPEFLSITHKLHSDHDAQLYVGEPRHASPDHGVSRWRIVCASEIAT